MTTSSPPSAMSSSPSLLTILDLPTIIRVRSFNLLDPESLMESSVVSKKFRYECNEHPGLENGIEPVIEIKPRRCSCCKHHDSDGKDCASKGGSTRILLEKLGRHCKQQKYRYDKNDDNKNNSAFTKLKRYCVVVVKNINKFDRLHYNKLMQLTKDVVERGLFDNVVALKMSHPSQIADDDDGDDNDDDPAPNFSSFEEYNSLPFALSYVLPSLREIYLTNTWSSWRVVQRFTERCPQLEKMHIVWNEKSNSYIFMNGDAMRFAANNLKVIIMDGFNFFHYYDFDDMCNLNDHHDTFLFHKCSNVIERVSIRNAKYGANYHYKPLPQTALIKFVRNAPKTLRWFRSDLTKENIDMLQKERPSIELIN